MNTVFDVLSPEEISTIHARSLRILSEIGIKIYSDELAYGLKKSGLNVDSENIVRFDDVYGRQED